jgi:hypothetical protein
VSASITIPYESRQWQDYRDTEGATGTGTLHFQVGSTLTNGACLFYLSALQVRDVQIVEVDGITMQRINLIGGVPIPNDLTDVEDSPFNVHMF